VRHVVEMRSRLEKWYDAHGGAIFAYALNLTRCEADACDLVQEVFLRASKRTLPLLRKPRHYFLRATHHAFVDLVRRRSTRLAAAEGARELELFAPDSPSLSPEFAEHVTNALSVLPDEQRAIVHLKIWEEMTFREISSVLGISGNTAASRYRYALDKLRAELRPQKKEAHEPA